MKIGCILTWDLMKNNSTHMFTVTIPIVGEKSNKESESKSRSFEGPGVKAEEKNQCLIENTKAYKETKQRGKDIEEKMCGEMMKGLIGIFHTSFVDLLFVKRPTPPY